MTNHDSAPEPTAEEQARIEHLVDTGVANYNDARDSVLSSAATRGSMDTGSGRRLPGKPNTFPKSGHVRDFADGGRADEFRGGMHPPSTPEAQASYEAARSTLGELQESLKRDKIQADYLADRLSYREAVNELRKNFGDRAPELAREDLGDENRKYTVVPRSR